MAISGLGCKFHDLSYFELDSFFFTIVDFIKLIEVIIRYFVENHPFNVLYHILNKSLTITCSISPLAHPLAPSSKICRPF
jgi:hypothetical protein